MNARKSNFYLNKGKGQIIYRREKIRKERTNVLSINVPMYPHARIKFFLHSEKPQILGATVCLCFMPEIQMRSYPRLADEVEFLS